MEDVTSGVGDYSTVAWVDGYEVTRGALTSLARTMKSAQGYEESHAYQEAFNHLVQGILLTEEARELGLEPTPGEVRDRTRRYLQEVEGNATAQAIIDAQARELGLDPGSEEFAQAFEPVVKRMMLSERLNEGYASVTDSPQEFAELKAQVIKVRMEQIEIEILYDNLPDEAQGLRVPNADEMPWVQQAAP